MVPNRCRLIGASCVLLAGIVAAAPSRCLAQADGAPEARAARVGRGLLPGFVVDGQQRIELFPEGPTRFFELTEEHDVEFVKGPDGAVTHMLIDGQQQARRIADPPIK